MIMMMINDMLLTLSGAEVCPRVGIKSSASTRVFARKEKKLSTRYKLSSIRVQFHFRCNLDILLFVLSGELRGDVGIETKCKCGFNSTNF